MMVTMSVRFLCATGCVLVLGGCGATASPRWDAEFGDHQRAMVANQLIDPNAPARNGQVLVKADGRTVREAGVQQVESFRAPPVPQAITIGIGR